MIVEGGHALELALGLWRVPARVAQARHRPLPDDLQPLLQLAAGDADLAAHFAAVTGETPAVLQDAAVFYLQQVLFVPGADHYRVLGVAPDAPEERIKQHYRWLVRWLHPDRNHDELERQYADRVNRAWQELRQPARRAEYDRQLAARGRPASDDELWGDAAPVPSAVFSDEPAPDPEGMSPETARRLPWLALGGLAASAAVALSLMWVLQPAGPSREHPLAQGPAAEPAPTVAPVAEPVAAAAPVPVEPPEARPALMDTLAQAPAAASPGPDVPGAGGLPAGTDAEAPAGQPRLLATDAGVRADAAPAAAIASPPPAPRPTNAARTAAAPPPASAPPGAPPTPRTAPVAARPAPPRPAAVPAATEGPAVDRTAASAPAAVPVPPVAPAPAPSEDEARELLAAFSQAYGAGDINGLMRLFTRDARNNRGGRDAIVYDYQSLFDASESRALLLETVAWVAEGDRALVLARYEAQVQRTGQRRSQRSRGDIRFELRREGGVPRILQVRHDTD